MPSHLVPPLLPPPINLVSTALNFTISCSVHPFNISILNVFRFLVRQNYYFLLNSDKGVCQYRSYPGYLCHLFSFLFASKHTMLWRLNAECYEMCSSFNFSVCLLPNFYVKCASFDFQGQIFEVSVFDLEITLAIYIFISVQLVQTIWMYKAVLSASGCRETNYGYLNKPDFYQYIPNGTYSRCKISHKL